MSLLQALHDGQFCLLIEFTPHTAEDVKRMASLGAELPALNARLAGQGIVVPAVTLTQSPGGSPSWDCHAAIAMLRELGWPAEIEIIPHITGKDRNSDALAMELEALPDRGVNTILALTGDKPVGRGVFERDSLGILLLLQQINAARLARAASDEDFAGMPLLRSGAAVSPFKYTPGSLAMQLIKAAKKIRTGAEFLVCQSGWDADRSAQLIAELQPEGIPLLGNVLLVNEPAARVMRDLPGCVITDAFLERLHGESEADGRTRAAQQLAMFRALGYRGVDLGKPGDWRAISDIESIVEQALAIPDWRAHHANITFAPPPQPEPDVSGSASMSHAAHRALFEESSPLHGVAKGLLSPVEASAEHEGFLYRLFRSMENLGKGAVYECGHCGDCFLPENEYVCTMGQCEKGLPNIPCGDADPSGRCGNNSNRFCVGEKVYRRLMHRGALEEYKQQVFPPRRAELRDTSSLLNRFFERDHASRTQPLQGSGLIQIAELLHASIPFAGIALRHLHQQGFERANRGLLAVTNLIRTQAEEGADYVDINIDALGAADAPQFMRQLVGLVFREALGVPPSVDSSDPAVLEAGLDAWHELAGPQAPALINSITWCELERYAGLLARRRERVFRVISLLVGREGPLKSSDEMVAAALAMFQRLRQDGFQAEDIFFDTVTLGIGTDGFVDAQGNLKSSHTRESFQAIRRIRQHPELQGVHAILGVSNWVYGAKKRRIGHLRAFTSVAMEHGLDAVIADVSRQLGLKPAPAELVDLVTMFTSLDGSDEAMFRYQETMDRMRTSEWV